MLKETAPIGRVQCKTYTVKRKSSLVTANQKTTIKNTCIFRCEYSFRLFQGVRKINCKSDLVPIARNRISNARPRSTEANYIVQQQCNLPSISSCIASHFTQTVQKISNRHHPYCQLSNYPNTYIVLCKSHWIYGKLTALLDSRDFPRRIRYVLRFSTVVSRSNHCLSLGALK